PSPLGSSPLSLHDALPIYAMQDMVVADPMGHLLASFTTLCVMAALAYARTYAFERDMLKGELFTLSMFSLLGANVMVSANNFLVDRKSTRLNSSHVKISYA